MNGGNPDIPLHRGRQVGKLWLLSDVDAVDAGPRDYFLKGMISPNEMSAIYGEPGCGKSFLALYISRAIAQSREIFGKRVHATNILFMALEGVSGFEKRLKAHILAHWESEYFTYIAQPVNLFSDPAAKEDVIAAIKTCEAGILFIDTLARAMSGGSENDPADMGKFIQTLDAIRLATGVHICVIHHSGKDAARGMRGHSSLLGAVDLSVEVKRDPDTGARIAIVNKAKDDPDGARYPFKLITRDMGDDEDGDPITTCVVEEDAISDRPRPEKTVKMSETDLRWMDQIYELFARDGATILTCPMKTMTTPVQCVTRDTLREWAKLKGLVGVTESVTGPGKIKEKDRTAMSRAISSLIGKKKIAVHENLFWIVR